ncbi:hypothetical protein GC174_08620 [bacterium]|nr:hypothetical protein [bacterium]
MQIPQEDTSYQHLDIAGQVREGHKRARNRLINYRNIDNTPLSIILKEEEDTLNKRQSNHSPEVKEQDLRQFLKRPILTQFFETICYIGWSGED